MKAVGLPELLLHLRGELSLEAAIGRFGTLVNVVAYEHEEIRREIAKFKEARSQLDGVKDPWPAIQELNRHGIFTIQFLWDHFRKEKVSLFPTAAKSLSGEQLREIGRRLGVGVGEDIVGGRRRPGLGLRHGLLDEIEVDAVPVDA
mgnify:CR=1 FL=1